MGIQRSNRIKKRIDLNSKMLNFYNAKMYYKQGNMWIAAQSAEQATQEACVTALNTAEFFLSSFREIHENLHNISKFTPKLEEKNPGLRRKLISLLED